MKFLLLLLISLTWHIVSSNSVLACQCPEYGTPVCASYWRSDAVFVGQLRDITPRGENTGPIDKLHFIVEQPFRGIASGEVNIETLSGTSCDMRFSRGKRYLVYANRHSGSGNLFTGACSRTVDLQHADEDLSYIRSLMQNGVTESVAGRVMRVGYEIMSGVRIEVRNEKRTFYTTTNKDGHFSVSLAGPGNYSVRLLPSSALAIMRMSAESSVAMVESTDVLTTIEYKVELGKSHCDYREFELYPIDLRATAEVSGTVLAASGHPVEKGSVYLQRGEVSKAAKIEADGTFKFEKLAAGEYFLVLNPDNRAPGEHDPPYSRTFYPNATEASSATKIVVTEGAKLKDLTLRVGPALKAREVSGRVVWTHGGAVKHALLWLYNADRWVMSINADHEGRFSFNVYGDFEYTLVAKVWDDRNRTFDRVQIGENSTNLTLVLKP